LHAAAVQNLTDVVQVLFEAGADVHAAEQTGFTPLRAAANCGHAHVVSLLLSYQADTECTMTDTGFTPLHYAAARGDEAVVRVLLKGGANLHASTLTDVTVLSAAATITNQGTLLLLSCCCLQVVMLMSAILPRY
jgi:ankyrin repeat protein